MLTQSRLASSAFALSTPFFGFKEAKKKMSGADELAKLRQQMAKKYHSLPAEAKPHDRICDDCKLSVYSSKICMTTGFFHAQKQETLIGGVLVDATHKLITGRELIEGINATRIQWQPSRVSLVKADATSLNIFQSFVMEMSWNMQRFGILYGKVQEGGVVEVHAVYEPEQRGAPKRFTPLPDAREASVDQLAGLLGLRRVGIVCTHPARDPQEIVLTGQELLTITRDQSRFGDSCVLLTMGPHPETGLVNAQAWQASEQCVNLYRLKLLDEFPEDLRFVRSSQPLEIAQETTDKAGHKQCIIKEPRNTIDTRWMTSFIAVEAFQSTVVSNTFVRISRPMQAAPTFANLRAYLADPKRNRLTFAEKIADFHVLIFLMENLFSVKSDMPVVAQGVLTKNSAMLKEFEEILKEAMKASP